MVHKNASHDRWWQDMFEIHAGIHPSVWNAEFESFAGFIQKVCKSPQVSQITILRPKKTCHYIKMRRVKKPLRFFATIRRILRHVISRMRHVVHHMRYVVHPIRHVSKKLRQVATRHNILRQVATGHDWSTTQTQLTFGHLHTMAISLQITTMATSVLYPTTTPSPTFRMRQMLHQHSTNH
jgi:hypothetical protein